MRTRWMWAAAIVAPIAWLAAQVSEWTKDLLASDPGDASIANVICLGSICTTIGCGLVAALYLRSASPIDTRATFCARTAVWLSAFALLGAILTER